MAVSDYFVNLGDPFERSINAFRGGYSDAKAMVGDAERRDERGRLVEARQAGTAAMQSLAALGGNATAQDYRVAAAANPEYAAAIQAQGKIVGSERSANDLRAAQGLFVALASPDAGEVIPAQLEKRIAAAEASGDKQTADAARAMLLTYNKPGGANALRVALGVSLSGGMPAGQFNYLVGEVYPKADLTDATKARVEQARLAGLTPGTPAFNRFMLTGKTEGGGGMAPATRALVERARLAGLTPGTPEYNRFILTEKYGEEAPGFRVATPAEMKIYGGPGQIGPDGRFYPNKTSTGTILTVDENGTVSYSTGVPTPKQQRTEQEAQDSRQTKLDIGERLLETIESVVGRAAAPGVTAIPADPSLEGMTGIVWGNLPPLTQGATNLSAKIKQIKGSAFLQAFESLKGGGPITEVEGQKATEALARLDRAQDVEEFRASLFEFADIVRLVLGRIKSRQTASPQSGSEGDGSVTIDGVRIERIN